MGTIPVPDHLTDTSSSCDSPRVTVTSPGLYPALCDYEDAAGEVGVRAIAVTAAYRSLTDAIGGHGSLEEARTVFALAHISLHDANVEWSNRAFALRLALSQTADQYFGRGPRDVPFDYSDQPKLHDAARGTTGAGDDL